MMKLVSDQTAALVGLALIVLLIVVPEITFLLGAILLALIVHNWWTSFTAPTFGPPAEEEFHDSSQLAVFMYMKHRYLSSPEWKQKRQVIHKLHYRKCDICQSTNKLQVHHISGYCRIPNEELSDLALLCDSCHQAQHDHYGYPKTYQDYMIWYAPLHKP
ncbi:MAG: hypothetical protein ACYDD5_01045 [Sulfuricurvum sp.]